MKKSICLCLFIFLLNTITHSQGYWQWQNPLPQGNILNELFVINENTAIAVGDAGTIMKTTDGGENWKVQHHVKGTFCDLMSIFFIDSNIGWVVGSNKENEMIIKGACILKTTDAGETWTLKNNSQCNSQRSVFFVNQDTGWICGNRGILKTTDGGENWSYTELLDKTNCVFFVNDSIGWLAGKNIYKTLDCGVSWNLQVSTGGLFPPYYKDIIFINPDTGWVVGNNAFKVTYDGGKKWDNVKENAINADLKSIHFIGSKYGFTVGTGGKIYKTDNFGLSWSDLSLDKKTDLNDVFFANMNTGWLIGVNGIIYKTQNSGLNWEKCSGFGLNERYIPIFYDVFFVDGQTGWAVGDGIWKTTTGGENWSPQPINTHSSNYPFLSAFFINDSTGWIVGNGGAIFKTKNGGESWISQGPTDGSYFRSVFFISDSVGWVAGSNGTIQKTINGGAEWISQSSGIIRDIFSIYFIDVNNGWAVGEYGNIIKTVDGGDSWFLSNAGIASERWTVYNAIFFTDIETGWIVGNYGEIIATTDGGQNWYYQDSWTFSDLRDIYFMNSDSGWVVGFDGRILATTNGGATWAEQKSSTSNHLLSICFPDNLNGWVVGDRETILKIDLSQPTSISTKNYHEKLVPNQIELFQNYPNPFNAECSIKYQIPTRETVSIVVFNMLGQKVKTLLNQVQERGHYQLKWKGRDEFGNSMNSGVYIYRIQAGTFKKSMKMILLQ